MSLGSSARRVLVVDDDPSIRELVSVRLTLSGHTVLTARHGRDALTRLRERRYDGMVLDLNMPELDGFGVLEQIDKHQMPPTLVLTASHSVADVQRAIKLGARDYLSKPFDDRQLLMRVARLFRVQPVKLGGLDELLSMPTIALD